MSDHQKIMIKNKNIYIYNKGSWWLISCMWRTLLFILYIINYMQPILVTLLLLTYYWSKPIAPSPSQLMDPPVGSEPPRPSNKPPWGFDPRSSNSFPVPPTKARPRGPLYPTCESLNRSAANELNECVALWLDKCTAELWTRLAAFAAGFRFLVTDVLLGAFAVAFLPRPERPPVFAELFRFLDFGFLFKCLNFGCSTGLRRDVEAERGCNGFAFSCTFQMHD